MAQCDDVAQPRGGKVRRQRWPCPHRWYADALTRWQHGTAEALWFAVLDNAIQAVRGKLQIPRKSRAFLAYEARRWVRSDAAEPLGTFVSICRELNLDIATVRADLLAITFVGQMPRAPRHLRVVRPDENENEDGDGERAA